MQPNIDISDVLRRSFDLYKENITTLLIATFLAFVISMFSVGILAGPMFAGLVLINLRLIDKRSPKPEIGDLFRGFDYFLPTLVYFILLGAALLAGMLFLSWLPFIGRMIFSLYLYLVLTVNLFSIFYIVERRMDVVAAIQKSFEFVRQNFWIFFAVSIVAGVAGSLGIIACGIGIIVTMPMNLCITAVVYRDLHPAPASA
jgi:hypothetical protein